MPSSKLALLAMMAVGAIAAPAASAPSTSRQGLSLVKTSETDPGQWVTDEQKLEFTLKNIGFVDITDVEDEEVLSVLSSPDGVNNVVARAVNYPAGAMHKEEGNKLLANVNTDGPQSWLKSLSDFDNRSYKTKVGLEAATWLFNQVKTIASKNSAITVKQFKHSRYNQPSIIATIPGTSPNLVVAGAHLDSVSDSGPAPGAEDDGSGTVVVLEALRVLAESGIKPKNTIEFHWYSGEEGGLLGSKDVWAQYKADKKTVIGYLNQDMAGYSPSGKPAVYTDYVNSALTTYVTALIKDYLNITPNTSKCRYGCSDHASANSNGFPAAFVADEVFEKDSPYIHSSQDTIDKIMWPTVLTHAKLTLSFLFEASQI